MNTTAEMTFRIPSDEAAMKNTTSHVRDNTNMRDSTNMRDTTNTCDITNSDNTTTRIQDLPPELFEMILDFVLTPNETTTSITTYTLPAQLQLSRSTRAIFAARYYPTITFTYPHDNCSFMVRILHSMPRNHRMLIGSIRAIGAPSDLQAEFDLEFWWVLFTDGEEGVLRDGARVRAGREQEEEEEEED